MSEMAAVVKNILTTDERKEGITAALSAEATLFSSGLNNSSELHFSSNKRRCMHPSIQSNSDLVLNEGNQPGCNLGINNFVSEIKITVNEYISQLYLVRGSPNYTVLKVSNGFQSFKISV